MFCRCSDCGYVNALPGIDRKTLVHGAHTLMTEFRMRAGSALPAHTHPHEQTGYLVRGRIRLRIGEETQDLGPGDSWCIPGGLEHAAQIIEDSLALEIFSPVRTDYLLNT